MQIPGDPAPRKSFGVIKTINKHIANAKPNLLILYWIRNDTPHDTLKWCWKILKTKTAAKLCFCILIHHLVCITKDYHHRIWGFAPSHIGRNKRGRTWNTYGTHTGKHNSWIFDSKIQRNSASQDTPCDDSYTPCASWPPQAFFGHSAEGSISCGGLQSIFNCGELAC